MCAERKLLAVILTFWLSLKKLVEFEKILEIVDLNDYLEQVLGIKVDVASKKLLSENPDFGSI